MIKNISLVIFSFFTFNMAYGQDAFWVRTITGNGYDDCRDMVCDSSGNVYVTGQIEYTATFNGSGYQLSSVSGHDIFVAKYDSAGNLKWAKRAGGSSGDVGYGVAYDFEGSVYVVGEFETTASFSGIQVTVQGSGNNMFIAKYDSTGDIQWVRPIGTNSGSTKGYAAACDAYGNVYALGTTAARAYYDGTSLFSSRGSSDCIFIKFDKNGDYKWVKQIGGSDSDKGYGLTVSGEDIYVTGYFEGSCKFSSSVTISSNGGMDFFLAKYDTLGTLKWAKKGGGSGDDTGWDVDVNINGNVVCTGEFQGNASFSSNSVSSNGNNDIFIVAYDDAGNNLWANSAGSNYYDIGRNIAHDRKGNVLVGGSFSDDADFDTVQITSNGDEDLFLASYDSSGSFRFVKHFGGPGNDRGRGVGADRYGNLYFSGEYWDYINFDSIYTPGVLLFDGFITRLGNFPVCSASALVTNDISCFNLCDGEVAVVANGEAPFSYTWLLAPQQYSDSVSGLCAGNYPVRVVDAFGCISTDTILLSQPAMLIIDTVVITGASCLSCSNGSIDITVSGGVGPYTYLWSDSAVSQDRSNLAGGFYDVCITDANGCEICDTYTVTTGTTTMEDITDEVLLRIYPNPVVDYAEVKLDQGVNSQHYNLFLLDITGRRLKQISLTSSTVYFDAAEFSTGLYFLELQDSQLSNRVSVLPIIIK